jgi:hypothetical protein
VLRPLIVLFLVLALMITFTACESTGETSLSPNSSSTPGGNTSDTFPTQDTQFSRMFDLVPYSFLKEHDIWFGEPGKAKQIYGFSDVNGLEAIIDFRRMNGNRWQPI